MKKTILYVVLLTSLFVAQLVTAQVTIVTNPSPAEICAGSGTFVSLTAPNDVGGAPALSYAWSTSSTNQSINVSPNITTTYTVTVTVLGGVTHTGTATVTVHPQPAQATITAGGPTTFCTGDSVPLNASAGNYWQWYLNGSPIWGANSQIYIATTSGNYTVLVTVGTCNAPMSSITTVTAVIPPVANVTPDGPLNVCYGNSITLTADAVPGAHYQWQYSPNGLAPWSNINGATNQSYDAEISGFYRVSVSVGACTNYSN